MVLESIATSITDPFTYWTFAALIGAIMYLFLTMMQFRYAALVSMVFPVVFLEFMLRFVFELLGTPLDFGSYQLIIPFTDPVEITNGVMLLRFLGFVFNFGLFREIGLPIFESFLATAPELPEASLALKVFVAIYVSADSLIEYVFFFYVFSAVLIILSDLLKTNGNIKLYAGILAAFPVLAYNVFVSNPFFEYEKAMPGLQGFGYFMEYAPTMSIVVFLVTLIVSFMIVMEILASIIAIFYETGSATFRPDWVQKRWEVNVQGVGFLFTLSFAIMYSMHQYEWYIFFPAMIVYSLFKNMAGGAVTVARSYEERRDMQEYMGTINNRPLVEKINARKQGSGINGDWIIYALVIIVLGMGVMLANNMGYL